MGGEVDDRVGRHYERQERILKAFPPGCRAQGRAAWGADPLERGCSAWAQSRPGPDPTHWLEVKGKCSRKRGGTQRPYIYRSAPPQERTKSLALVPRQGCLWWGQGLPDLPGYLHGCTLPTGQWLYKRRPHLASHSCYPSSLPYQTRITPQGPQRPGLAHCWVPSTPAPAYSRCSIHACCKGGCN